MSQPTEPRTPNLSMATNTKVLAVLSNEIRLEVLMHLTRSEKCVADIALELQLDQSTVSHALRKLADIGLVTHEIVKRQHIYTVTNAVKADFDGDAVQIEIIMPGISLTLRSSDR